MTASNDFKLKVYDSATRKWQELSDIPSTYPHWSADSQCVTFTNSFEESLPVYRVCLVDHKEELIVNLMRLAT